MFPHIQSKLVQFYIIHPEERSKMKAFWRQCKIVFNVSYTSSSKKMLTHTLTVRQLDQAIRLCSRQFSIPNANVFSARCLMTPARSLCNYSNHNVIIVSFYLQLGLANNLYKHDRFFIDQITTVEVVFRTYKYSLTADFADTLPLLLSIDIYGFYLEA